MASLRSGTLPSVRRQHLLAEFAGLRQACPEGIFMSLTPGDPTLWSGVMFVRKGPYATAILHFQISFPDTYPGLPPLVTFSTDIFHPLITPLNTYMYTTDIQDGGTVSATDDERLPPGGFSLRHGFPAWFGRGGGGGGSRSRQQQQQQPGQPAQTPPRSVRASQSTQSTPGSAGSAGRSPGPLAHHLQTRRRGDVSTYAVLRYIRRTFDDEAALDSVPLEAAGNPGAWHAWRAHQRQLGKAPAAVAPTAAADEGGPPRLDGEGAGGAPAVARRPGEWNWEHVWEERVRKGIAASLSEPVLYGNAGAADDVIRFLNLEEGDITSIKENLKRTLDVST